MISPRCMDSVDGNGRVERQCQTEKPKEQAKPHTSAPFQKPADRERAKKSPDKHDHGDRVPLCFRQRTKHQTLSISEGRSLKQVLWRQTLSARRFACRFKTATDAVALQFYRVGAMMSHAQPARKQRPPGAG